MNETILDAWRVGLGESFQGVSSGVASFVPKLLVAVIIFIAGWAVAAILGRVVSQIIRSVKVDNVLKSAGADDVLSRAGFHLDSGAFMGALVRWFVIIVFLVASLDVLGLTQVNAFLREVVLGYLPQVIAAALILLVAAVLADAMQKVVVGGAKAAEMKSASLLGGVTRWSIWVFAFVIALSQLGIAPAFMQILFTGVVVMLALAGGLAFGLGGRDAASEFIARLRRDIS